MLSYSDLLTAILSSFENEINDDIIFKEVEDTDNKIVLVFETQVNNNEFVFEIIDNINDVEVIFDNKVILSINKHKSFTGETMCKLIMVFVYEFIYELNETNEFNDEFDECDEFND